MTSTEFSARYRLLKCIAERGARTFLAQQVELGRMVMVHYLDAGNQSERQQLRDGLESLTPAARQKLLEVTDVDGVTVAVSSFIPSFQDLPSWLAENGAPSRRANQGTAPSVVPGEFTRAFQAINGGGSATSQSPVITTTPSPTAPPVGGVESALADAPTVIIQAVPHAATPTPAAEPPSSTPTASVTPAPAPPAPAGPGEFTRVFGGLTLGDRVAKAPPAPPAAPLSTPAAFPPAPLTRAAAHAPASSAAPPSPITPGVATPAPGEFTQLFSKVTPASAPAPSLAAAPTPFTPPAPVAASLPLPPLSAPAPLAAPTPLPSGAAAAPPVVPPLAPPPLASFAAGPSGFPSAPPPLAPPPMSPCAEVHNAAPPAPDLPRALELTPRADLAAPVPTPPPAAIPPAPLALSPLAPPSAPAPFSGVGLPSLQGGTPTPPSWNNAAPSAPLPLSPTAPAGPSEFTRILGKVTPGAPQPARMATPAVPMPLSPTAQAASGANATGAAPQKRSLIPLIIALNVVLIATVGVILYFALRH